MQKMGVFLNAHFFKEAPAQNVRGFPHFIHAMKYHEIS